MQLIDATGWSTPLRENPGEKGVEVRCDSDADNVLEAFTAFDRCRQTPDPAPRCSTIDFGYQKIIVERPLRIVGVDPNRVYTAKEIKQLKEDGVRETRPRPRSSRRRSRTLPCPTRCTAVTRRSLMGENGWWSTSLTPSSAIPNKCR